MWVCKWENRNRGEWCVQATGLWEVVAHGSETLNKRSSLSIVLVLDFPREARLLEKGSVSVSPDMDVYSFCGQLHCQLKRIHLTVLMCMTHTHFLGVDRRKRKTLAHGDTVVSRVNRHVRPRGDSVCDSIVVTCLDLAFGEKWGTIL